MLATQTAGTLCSLALTDHHNLQQLRGALAQTAGLSDSARKQVGWWLAGCSGWVFSMVVLGGMTRLTRSGLSMTDWKFTGERPPTSLVSFTCIVLLRTLIANAAICDQFLACVYT